MTTEFEDPRAEIQAAAAQQSRVQTQNALEHTVLQRFLRHLAPQFSLPALRARLGKEKAGLAVLPEILSGLPLRLIAAAVYGLDDIRATDLLAGDLAGTRLFRIYAEQADACGLDLRHDCLGLIVPWRGATTVILHNWPRTDETLDTGRSYGRFVLLSSKHTKTPVLYSLEPLDSFIAALQRAGVGPRSD